MKHSKLQFLTAIAAVAAGLFSLQAKTVAWYHFNEGASGTKPTAGEASIVNAADPGSLNATTRVKRSWQIEDYSGSSTYLPTYYADFPSCVSWFDPVTGVRGADRLCVYLKSGYNFGHGDAPLFLVNDDVKLHCANLTAECMVKMTASGALSYQSHMLVMRNAPSPNNIKAWGVIINTSGSVSVEVQTRDSTGVAIDASRSMSFTTKNAPSVVDGKWHHVAFTYDGSTARIYVDYVEYASKAWSEPIDYNENYEGRLNIAGLDVSTYGGHWYGYVDEVRISDEALPPEHFLRVSEEAGFVASDADTAIYLPFNTMEITKDPFFFNSAYSTNAGLIDLKLSTYASGVYPRLDTGVSAVVSNELHSGVFATNTIINEGCWTYTNNPAYPEKARYIIIDDFSKNNNTHLISSGDFTAEFFLKVPTTPTIASRILVENTGSKGAGTIQLLLTASELDCTLYSQDEIDKYEAGTVSSMTKTKFSTPVSNVVGGDWHHVALVVDRTNQRAALYLDGNPVGTTENFVLASGVSTYSDAYKTLKIGDGWSGNGESALHDLSIDEFRITRRALAPQEFLMAGAAPASGAIDPTRAWIGFEGDLSVKPDEGAIPEGSSNASTVTMEYAPVVPGIRLVDGNGNVFRDTNMSSMHFADAHGSGESSPDTASQRLFFGRNILLEKDMKSMTVEFFMKGTKNEAKAWATILRMYGNATGSDSSPFRRLWSVGYSNAAGNIYVIKDVNGASQSTFYPSNTVSFADGKWHHIAVTFAPDGNGKTLCNFYKDYQQLGSQHTFNGELECGDYGTSSFAIGSRYNGYIDEVRISKGVLSVDQMLHVTKNGTVISIR